MTTATTPKAKTKPTVPKTTEPPRETGRGLVSEVHRTTISFGGPVPAADRDGRGRRRRTSEVPGASDDGAVRTGSLSAQ